jgi:hypothetical protein
MTGNALRKFSSPVTREKMTQTLKFDDVTHNNPPNTVEGMKKQKQTRHTPTQTRWRTFRFKRRKEVINNVTLVGEEEENRFSFLPCWMPCRWRNDAFVSSPTDPNTSPALPTFPRPDGCMFHLLRNGWKKKVTFRMYSMFWKTQFSVEKLKCHKQSNNTLRTEDSKCCWYNAKSSGFRIC